MRGKEQVIRNCRVNGGITPAYAGKSAGRYRGRSCVGDHPRICGEKDIVLKRILRGVGSPPHMRGKADNINNIVRSIRITPAYAGKS